MEEYKIKLTPQAKEHLIQIRDYIGLELSAPVIAKNILEFFKEKIKTLSYLPERNPQIIEEPWGSNGVRKLIVKNYYVYYIISETEKTVKIIAVIYGKREQNSSLEELEV